MHLNYPKVSEYYDVDLKTNKETKHALCLHQDQLG